MMPLVGAFSASDAELVPDDAYHAAGGTFIVGLLIQLVLLSKDEVVQQYLSAEPRACQPIRSLSAAVAAAGQRVHKPDRLQGTVDEQSKLFTDEEIWLVSLAVDVVAMLATLGSVAPNTRETVISHIRSLDEHVTARHWKHAVRKADPGPPEFHDLRALVPHHQPYPHR
jgi:hypothetical protein